jgi:hypothetical protein
MTGKGLSVAFLGHAGGPVLATAIEAIPGCPDVHFMIGGRMQAPLTPTSSFWPDVLAIAGVRWRGYP